MSLAELYYRQIIRIDKLSVWQVIRLSINSRGELTILDKLFVCVRHADRRIKYRQILVHNLF